MSNPVSFEFLETLISLYKSCFKRESDGLVVFVHWYLVKSGYKCLTKDGHVWNHLHFKFKKKKVLILSHTNFKLTELLPEDWNSDENVYTIKYSKDSNGYELKVLIVDENLIINLAVIIILSDL